MTDSPDASSFTSRPAKRFQAHTYRRRKGVGRQAIQAFTADDQTAVRTDLKKREAESSDEEGSEKETLKVSLFQCP